MNNKYYIYGKHSAISAILNPNRLIHKILISENFNIDSLIKLLNQNNYTKKLIIKINTVSNKDFHNILGSKNNHQGIAVLTEELQHPNLHTFIQSIDKNKNCTLAALDQVTDPTNIGAILRSAAAFGIQAIIIPKHNTPRENSTIAKIATGSLETIPILQVTNLYNAMNTLKSFKFWIIGLDSNTNRHDINSINQYNKIVLIFGNEHKGLRNLTKKSCDLLLKIPFKKNNIESLNLSNAAAITFYLRFSKNYN